MIYQQTPVYIYTTGKYGDGTFGQLKAVVDNYATLQYVVGFYSPGNFQLTINKAIPKAENFKVGRMIRVGDDDTKIGLIRGVVTTLTQDGQYILDVTGTEFWGIIGQRQVVPASGDYAFTSSSATPVETGLKAMISGQIGSLAAVKRRMPYVNIVSTSGRGPNLEMSERYSNLLDAATRMLTSSGCGLFASLNLTTMKCDIDFYTGTDRSATVIFSSGIDTLESAKYNQSDVAYRNISIVGGQGDGVARTIRTVYEGTEPEGFDRQEMFNDARDLTTTTSLDNRGIQKLQEVRFTRFIEFDSLTYSKYVYGVNFFCGDEVTIREFGIDQKSRIISVSEEHKNGDFDLKLVFDKEAAEITKQVGAINETTVRQNAIF